MMPGEPGPRPEPTIEDLTDTSRAVTPAQVRDELLAQMGEDVPRPPRPPDHPDVSGIARQLGLA